MSIKDLPLDKGSRISKVFEHLGFKYEGLSEKKHHIFTDPKNPHLYLSVPNHPKVDRNTLKAEIRKSGKTDLEFCKAYDELYGRGKKASAEVHELQICSMCREIIKPEDETVVHQESGLSVHKSCHEKQIGPARRKTLDDLARAEHDEGLYDRTSDDPESEQ